MPTFKCPTLNVPFHLSSAFLALETAVLFALLELSPEAETDGVMGDITAKQRGAFLLVAAQSQTRYVL